MKEDIYFAGHREAKASDLKPIKIFEMIFSI
jgi:hypothetical protein